MKELKDRVRETRGEMQLTQTALAKLAGVKQQNIQQLEDGAVKRPRYLPELADALGVNLKWLLTGHGPKRLGGEAEDAGDSGQVLQIIRRMEGKVTPRSRRTLLRLEKIAIEGKMTDEDWELVEQIVERFEGRQGD